MCNRKKELVTSNSEETGRLKSERLWFILISTRLFLDSMYIIRSISMGMYNKNKCSVQSDGSTGHVYTYEHAIKRFLTTTYIYTKFMSLLRCGYWLLTWKFFKLQCWSSIQGPLCSAFVWNHLSKIAIIRQKDLEKILKPFCFCKGALLLHCKGTFSFKEPKLLGLWEPGRGWSWGEVDFQRRMLCSPRSSWSDSGKATFLVIPVLSSLSTRFVS